MSSAARLRNAVMMYANLHLALGRADASDEVLDELRKHVVCARTELALAKLAYELDRYGQEGTG